MINSFFPVKIYKTEYTENLKALKKSLLPKLESVFEKTKLNNQDSMRGGGLCSYNAVRDIQHWPELKTFIDWIQPHIELYWKELGYDINRKPVIFEMWANRYDQGAFIDLHNHSPITITASFNLSKESNDSGNIVFENPLETLLKHQPIDHSNIDNYGSWFQEEIDIKEGNLIMFPGWLKHKTTKNTSKKPRIILGCNIVGLV